MRWFEDVYPVRMARVALVAPTAALRDMLVAVAASGTVEIDAEAAEGQLSGIDLPGTGSTNPQAQRPHPPQDAATPTLSAHPPDLAALARDGRHDLLAGERQLLRYAGCAVRRHSTAALAGWTPAHALGPLRTALEPAGCAVVVLRKPRGVDPPTLITGSARRRALSPLVSTYGTVPYPDANPAWLAWASYVLMFGMMFGDVGDGLLLIAAALALRAGWPAKVRRYRAAWPFVAGAGCAATLFGFAYGEFFGPTGAIPALWLDPVARPLPLLAAGLWVGAALLAGAFALGVVNRWREGGWRAAFYAPSGLAGAGLFVGAGLIGLGWFLHGGVLIYTGAGLASVALLAAFAGFVAAAGGGGYGLLQAVIEVFDLIIRLGSNVASFARLAAFGLAHAALGVLVWDGFLALWDRGGIAAVAGIVLFVMGSALAFALEGLVAAVQALRLEYYELFSRVFVSQGRPFRPWQLRIQAAEAGRGHNGPAMAAAAAAIGLKEG
jgi:V/A-type H+/Na+-transporting ATPase subunit I